MAEFVLWLLTYSLEVPPVVQLETKTKKQREKKFKERTQSVYSGSKTPINTVNNSE